MSWRLWKCGRVHILYLVQLVIICLVSGSALLTRYGRRIAMTQLLADSALGTTVVVGVHRDIDVLLFIISYTNNKKVLCSSEI